MKLRSVTELQASLDGDFGWRVKEIDSAKTLVRRNKSRTQVTVARAGIALIYAHWEGYVKSSAEMLLNFVRYRNLTYKQLRPCFAAHGFAGELVALTTSGKHEQRSEAIKFVLGQRDARATFPWRNVIRAKGNLNAATFRDIAAAIGVECSRYESRYNWIDEILLGRRNSIAHGERLEFDIGEFDDIADRTLELMRWFKTDIENGVSTESYRAAE